MTAPGPAVVVGGVSGIGAAVAAKQRAAGRVVVVWDRAPGGDIACDIADPAQVDRAAAATLQRIGTPAQLTVTAGVGHGGLLADVGPEDWDRVMGINAKGVWLAMRSLAGPMREAGGGSVIAVSSVSSRLVDRAMGLYCASKAALDMVVQVAAAEWAPTVRVNAVAPGVTDTAMLGPAPRDGTWLAGVAARTALGRLGSPEEVADAVLALHELHWVTGQVLQCDGGLALHSPIDAFGASRPHRP